MMNSINSNEFSYLKCNDETSSTKSPIENRNLKHFKKSMIVEYESCNINEDSHSSNASSHHSDTARHVKEDDQSNAPQTSKAFKSEPTKHRNESKSKKHRLDDVFENENSEDDED